MTKLLYIAGLSRSGSTLLELLLGSHSGVLTVGELQVLPHELRGDVRIPCGCGLGVADCPFWNEVVAIADPLTAPAPQLDFFREHYGWGSTLRPTRLQDFSTPGATRGIRRQMQQYGRNTSELIEAVAHVAEHQFGARPEAIVDASKDPYRALWLARSGAVDLRLIHLVRDPHGSVHSLTNHRNDPVSRDLTAARRSLAWEVENRLVRRLIATLPGPQSSIVIRYEDLSADPIAQVGRALSLIGRDADPDAIARYQSTQVHTVAGNPMRGDRRPIRLDERWRTELAPTTRTIVSGVTRSRGRYGYD